MPQRFVATENAFEKGIEKTSASAGAKLAGEWAEALRGADFSGSKGLAGNLEKLQKALEGDSPDGGKIQSLLGEIADATEKAAERADNPKVAEKVRGLAKVMRA